MSSDPIELATKVAIYFIPFLFALCFHEYAHGWVARRRGDNTAQMMGRLTMNPVAHMDIIGTLILPILSILTGGIFFGWAKPVPVNERNLKNPRTDMFWIALAGPASNFILAIAAALVMWIMKHFFVTVSFYQAAITILGIFIGTNVMLGIFNAIPLHPLDGGKILARFLPAEINDKLEENQHITSMILLALFLFGALRILAVPVHGITLFLIERALG